MYRHQNTSSESALSEVVGFNRNPAELFRKEMEQISANMQDLPFYRHDIPCFTPNFILYEGQWIGTVLTPWMISIIVIPGPEQLWEGRTVGDKLGLQLPYKTMTFTVSSINSIPQYLSCSLLSPIDPSLTPEQAVQLTKDCLTMLLSLPIKQQVPDISKRSIFSAMLK
ncbi:hydrogenase-2 assembly chaperone [Actinobacillus genomosp. 1]|uniref:hydrogenase-2 assembly chaperone n=1 Tax=Actinobacillus genomosp. 1 TaxID=254839 RepID=UPI0024430FEC|nr:hydrogenase-2 assembly chaperone [Actinobacillus genomosp. 1]WGE35337.1 hydrogenase-2 assembly chaperone [Actinobacillus genomosp. 1]